MKKDQTTISVNGGPQVPLDLAMKAADKIMGKLKTESRMLMCRLTDDEQRVRGTELADGIKAHGILEEKKRDIGDQIKLAEGNIERLAETVKHKQEERAVVCTLTPDYDADSMTVRRSDTGEIVCVRQLTHMERNPDLPLDLPPEEPKAEAKRRKGKAAEANPEA